MDDATRAVLAQLLDGQAMLLRATVFLLANSTLLDFSDSGSIIWMLKACNGMADGTERVRRALDGQADPPGAAGF